MCYLRYNMNSNCCKEFAYKFSNYYSKNNTINTLLLKQFQTCMNLKNMGSKFNNCIIYEKQLLNNKKY